MPPLYSGEGSGTNSRIPRSLYRGRSPQVQPQVHGLRTLSPWCNGGPWTRHSKGPPLMAFAHPAWPSGAAQGPHGDTHGTSFPMCAGRLSDGVCRLISRYDMNSVPGNGSRPCTYLTGKIIGSVEAATSSQQAYHACCYKVADGFCLSYRHRGQQLGSQTLVADL